MRKIFLIFLIAAFPGMAAASSVATITKARTMSSVASRSSYVDSVLSGSSVSSTTTNTVSIDACDVDVTLPGCASFCAANPTDADCASTTTGGTGSGGSTSSESISNLTGDCKLYYAENTGFSTSMTKSTSSSGASCNQNGVWTGSVGSFSSYATFTIAGISETSLWSITWSGCATASGVTCVTDEQTVSWRGVENYFEATATVKLLSSGESKTLTYTGAFNACGWNRPNGSSYECP